MKKQWLIMVVVLVIGLIGGYFINNLRGNGNNGKDVKDVSSKFIQSITKGDIDGTYAAGSAVYQARNSKDYIKKVSESVKSDTVKIDAEEVYFGSGDNSKEAIYLATANNLPKNSLGNTFGNFVIRLVQEDGTWKVDSSQVY